MKTDADYRRAAATPKKPMGRPKNDTRYITTTPNVKRPKYDATTRSYELLAKEKGGVRHQLSKRFLLDIYDDWRTHGSGVLASVRAEDPSTYLRIMASLVPKTLQIEDSNDGKSTNELRTELLVELGRALERGDAQLTEHIEELQRGAGQGPLIEVQAVPEAEGLPQERSKS